MLVEYSILVFSPFHDPIRNLAEIKPLDIVCKTPSRAWHLAAPAIVSRLLVENLQMRRVDGILHRLEPVAVELWLNKDFSCPVPARPNIVLWHHRQRRRAHVGPIQPDEFLYRVSPLSHGEPKFALRRLRRR